MDNKISVPGSGRRGRPTMSRVVAGDSAQQGDDYLCGVDQSRSCAYADRDTSEFVGIKSGAISEQRSSQPEEFHLQLLSEPGVSLSTHRAPIIPTNHSNARHQCGKSEGCCRRLAASHSLARVLCPRSRLYFLMAHRTSTSSR